MTKEQEEIIERLNRDANTPLYCGDITIVNIEDIETVLNMLKEKDKLYHKALSDLVKADRENIQLNRQIDLMSRAIDNYDSQLEINTFRDKEHIKQYFKEIVERKSEEWKLK